MQDARQHHKEEQPLHDPAHTHHPPEAIQLLPELAPVVKNQQGSAIPAEQLDLERVNKEGRGGQWQGISTLRPVPNITPHWQFLVKGTTCCTQGINSTEGWSTTRQWEWRCNNPEDKDLEEPYHCRCHLRTVYSTVKLRGWGGWTAGMMWIRTQSYGGRAYHGPSCGRTYREQRWQSGMGGCVLTFSTPHK